MYRLKRFELKWCDAFGKTDLGIESSTIYSGDKIIEICFRVKSKTTRINLVQNEDSFIAGVENTGLSVLNGNHFSNDWYCDGDHWFINIEYDDRVIKSSGDNSYPFAFTRFIEYLHRDLGVPNPYYYKNSKKKSNNCICERAPLIER